MSDLSTDKRYWHRYLPEYERLVFSNLTEPSMILEWGVLDGASIKFLSQRFPKSAIVGVDILSYKDSWPHSSFISYEKVDQGNTEEVRSLYAKYGQFDLIIDDGSHKQDHQANCLKRAIQWMRHGGYYIVEDVHGDYPNEVLTVLLALEHLRQVKQQKMFYYINSSLFTRNELMELAAAVVDVHVLRRSLLPIQCWMCRGSDFNYMTLKCNVCKEPLYKPYDSMSVILKF